MKKYILPSLVLIGVAAFANFASATAPSIAEVKYKQGGDSPKIYVRFDQSVNDVGGGALGVTNFALAGATGTGKTILAVEKIGMDMSTSSDKYVVYVNANIATIGAVGQWTVAASSAVVNAGSEPASTSAVDLNENGDNTAPTALGAYLWSPIGFSVMFSELMASSTHSLQNYSNLLTSAVDTPAVESASLVSERTFAMIGVASSTTILGWGTGNTIDVGDAMDLVGNPMAATTTLTILPAIKIGEVKAGAASNTQDEFVEIYNSGGMNVDMTDLFLHVRTGATDTNKSLTKFRTNLPGNGFYLMGSGSNYSGTVSLDATYNSASNDITADSGVYISASSTADVLVIDLIGMGNSQIKETATTSVLTAGKSFERKAMLDSTTTTMAVGDASKGNSYDSNNNSADFLLRDIPQPQNASSSVEFPWGGPGQSDTTPPQVMSSFPGGNSGEIVSPDLSFAGFNFTEQIDSLTVTTSTVQLYLSSAPATNLCASVTYTNFPESGQPAGKCILSAALTSAAHT